MKTLLLSFAILLMLAHQIAAQKTNFWKGGQAGRENDWNQPRNWSLGYVPDWTCHVVIPDSQIATRPQPVLKNGDSQVQSVVILPGASLVVESGASLWLLGLNAFETPLENFGTLVLKGKLLTDTGLNHLALKR